MRTINDNLSQVNSTITKQTDEISSLNASVTTMKKDIAVLQQSGLGAREEIEKHTERLQQVENRCTVVETTVAQLASDIKATTASTAGTANGGPATSSTADHQHLIHQLEAANLRDEVVITGIPEGAEQSLLQVVLNFFTLIGITLSRTSIVACHRLGKLDRDKCRAIRIKLSSVSLVDSVLQEKRKKGRITASQLDASWSSTSVLNVNRRVPRFLVELRGELLRALPQLLPRAVWFEEASVVFKHNEKHYRARDRAAVARLAKEIASLRPPVHSDPQAVSPEDTTVRTQNVTTRKNKPGALRQYANTAAQHHLGGHTNAPHSSRP